ncbi:hypothetical protein Tco_1073326 [Tanacetum coccineum]
MVAWFLGLEDVLSWLLVKGKCDAIKVNINAVALFRQAIRSSPGRNDGTASPDSSWGNSQCGCCEIRGESMKKAFQDMLHGLGEVNLTHAYYNGSRTSKDNEDPSWSTSFKTKRTQKTSSALEVL